LPMSRCQVML